MRNDINKKYLTLGGPIIIPVQCVRVISSSFSKPQLIVPSPTPFWPCSSSSKRRKFRGTTETGFIAAYNRVIHHNSWLKFTRMFAPIQVMARRWYLSMVNLLHYCRIFEFFASGKKFAEYPETNHDIASEVSTIREKTTLFYRLLMTCYNEKYSDLRYPTSVDNLGFSWHKLSNANC